MSELVRAAEDALRQEQRRHEQLIKGIADMASALEFDSEQARKGRNDMLGITLFDVARDLRNLLFNTEVKT